jgi:prepilin-type N-terminal cleavage/methylation domain-containing protein
MKNGLIFRRGRKRGGFTLVELLVVIAIIALLLSILMPSLKRAREMARAIVCANNLRQGMTSIRMYTYDHNGRLPGIFPDYWFRLINPYSGNATTSNPKGFGYDWSRCPSATKDAKRTYAANYPTVMRHEPGYYVGIDKSANLDNIPPKVFILGDHYGKFWGADPRAVIYHPQGWRFSDDWDGNGKIDTAPSTGAGPYNGWYPWHSKAGNMVYADNSVRPLKLAKWEEVWIKAFPNISSGKANWDFWGRYGFDSYR